MVAISDRLEQQLRTLVAIVAQEPCCLCNGDSDVVGVFMAHKNHARAYEAPKDKNRMVFYAICGACLHLPDSAKRIEKELRRTIHRGEYQVVREAK